MPEWRRFKDQLQRALEAIMERLIRGQIIGDDAYATAVHYHEDAGRCDVLLAILEYKPEVPDATTD